MALVNEAQVWGAPAERVAEFKAVSYAELQEWERARGMAEQALAGPKDSGVDRANMLHIVGKAFYFREDLSKAIAAFREAIA